MNKSNVVDGCGSYREMWKIPYRQVYCTTFRGWVKEMIWIYVIRRVFAKDIEAIACNSCRCHGFEPPK